MSQTYLEDFETSGRAAFNSQTSAIMIAQTPMHKVMGTPSAQSGFKHHFEQKNSFTGCYICGYETTSEFWIFPYYIILWAVYTIELQSFIHLLLYKSRHTTTIWGALALSSCHSNGTLKSTRGARFGDPPVTKFQHQSSHMVEAVTSSSTSLSFWQPPSIMHIKRSHLPTSLNPLLK